MRKLITIVFVTVLTFVLIQKESSVELVVNINPEPRMEHPELFAELHRDIRTGASESKLSYPPNYQWDELSKAKNARRMNFSARTQSTNGVKEWKERGPGNVPGRTRAIVIDPDDPTHNTWFAGSASGGIWKTTNGGSNWTWLTPDIPNMATNSMIMAPTKHNIIYAGTGEESLAGFAGIAGHGLLKSTDRGATWELLENTKQFKSINRLAIDPSNEQIVLVASDSGIFRTQDGTATWTLVYKGVVQDLKPTPGNFQVLYAAVRGAGIIKSENGGIDWIRSSKGLPNANRTEIAVSPINPNIIFASTNQEVRDVPCALYVSENAGESWQYVEMNFDGAAVNYMGDQGWYNNTVAADLLDVNSCYVGGISVFKVTLDRQNSTGQNYDEFSIYSDPHLVDFVNFTNLDGEAVQLERGSDVTNSNVEIRFGAGKTQFAHRFLVPDGRSSGVVDEDYSYQDYVTVPFEVWDINNNKQLMVSFRDQDRNGIFNLKALNTDGAAIDQSREYLYVHNVNYSENPEPEVMKNGGMRFSLMYFFWPHYVSDFPWNPDAIPEFTIFIVKTTKASIASNVKTVIDPYEEFDLLNELVHPDQHNITIWKEADNTQRILLGNDGGLYLSNISATPGINEGDWTAVGLGYNTSQFYGIDKKPNALQFVGGTQDNGTWAAASDATAQTAYSGVKGGDGFECLWHYYDPSILLATSQFGAISKMTFQGNDYIETNQSSTDNFPFITKLSNSYAAPDFVYTIGKKGVYKSSDFGSTWTLHEINDQWSFSINMDIDVSRANANIVWAGNEISSTSSIHVSTDQGETFRATNRYIHPKLGTISKLATHPTEEKTAYILFSIAKAPKILRTADLGNNWEDISGFDFNATSSNGFPDVAVYCLYVMPHNTDIIWAGTEIGIVESLDNGATWNILEDFPNMPVWDMKGLDNYITIGTHGRGIWTAEVETDQLLVKNPTITSSSWTERDDKLYLDVNIPNTFDSLRFVVNNQVINTQSNEVPVGTVNATITDVQKPSASVYVIGYKNGAPYYSQNQTTTYVGIEKTLNPSFSVYPNPITDGRMTANFTLRKAGDVMASIRSLSGTTVWAGDLGQFNSGTHQKLVEARDLSSGLYILTLATEQEQMSQRIYIAR